MPLANLNCCSFGDTRIVNIHCILCSAYFLTGVIQGQGRQHSLLSSSVLHAATISDFAVAHC